MSVDPLTPPSLLERLGGWPMPARLAAVLVLNSLIALVLTAIEFGGSLGDNLVFSQCIGLAILVGIEAVFRLVPRHREGLRAAAALATVPLGSVAGTALAIAILGHAPLSHLWRELVYGQSVLLGLFFGGLCAVLFTIAERLRRARERLREQQLDLARTTQAETEAQLRLLRAQVEPHFLFNALANVASVIETDPPRARRMLERLNEYLRGALHHSREGTTTLAQELELVTRHIELLDDRMPGRLRLAVDVPDELRARTFPPMLLQPLVENAVKHGLEPKVGGGTIGISAHADDDGLTLTVADDGVGFVGAAGSGNGLANLRARLAAFYGPRAQLTLAENPGGGVTARLRLPESASHEKESA